MKLDLQVPKKVEALYKSNARYKGMAGGRGSSKSWSAIDYILIRASRNQNLNVACFREIQKSIKFSSKKLLSDRITALNMHGYFEILSNEIRSKKGDGIMIFQGLQDHTADSMKSLESFDICFVEEAQSITQHSMDLLTPTFRKEGAELIFAWNPRYKTDAVEELFSTKSNSVKIHINYLDNPFCPTSIKEEAEEMKLTNFSKYKHIYLGGYLEGGEGGIIDAKWISTAINGHKKLNYEPKGLKRAGYDVADDGNDDNAVVTIHGNLITSCKIWNSEKDEMVLNAQKVKGVFTVHNIEIVNYDNIGVGAGMGSIFNQLGVKFDHYGFTANAKVMNPDSEYKKDKKNKDAFKDLKAQGWKLTADKLMNTYNYIERGIECDFEDMLFIDGNVDNLDELISELSEPREEKDGSGRMMVESKKSLKKRGVQSPNIADALIMACMDIEKPKVNPFF